MPESENETERLLMNDKEHYDARLRNIKLEMACSIIAIFPFSLMFETLDVR